MISANEFLTRHGMHPERTGFEELVRLYRLDMDAALRGDEATLCMIPSFLRADAEPLLETPVLVIDAGGTNLRAGRMHFDAQQRPVLDCIKKRRMPGANGNTVTAKTLFDEIAAFALEYADCEYACIGFSYVCDILPSGDGRIRRLCKELQVTGAEGILVCDTLEKALIRQGAPGHRHWRLINDSVGSLLGGMAEAEPGKYQDFIGFILGTGTNTCCRLPSSAYADKDAAALGGETVVNMESGCFGRIPAGDADRRVDANSDLPGDHLAEKMISGAYYRCVLRETLIMAAEEGTLPTEDLAALRALPLSSKMIDLLCAGTGDDPISNCISTAEGKRFAYDCNELLLRRSAKIAAACLCAVLEKRALPKGSRVFISADGSMIRYNPMLLREIRALLAVHAGEKLGVETEFCFVEDASLKGCAWAGLV